MFGPALAVPLETVLVAVFFLPVAFFVFSLKVAVWVVVFRSFTPLVVYRVEWSFLSAGVVTSSRLVVVML